MKKRAWIFFGLLAVLFGGLGLQLARLTQTPPVQVAGGQNSYSISVNSTRGTIYDCNLQPLVNSEKRYAAAILPDELLLTRLRPAMDEDAFRTVVKRIQDRLPAAVWLTEPVGITQGIRLFFTERRYGVRAVAPHLIGYLDGSGQRGVTGLEAAFDDYLKQYSGEIRVSYSVSGNGTYLTGVEPTVTDTTARSSGGVVLTIDKAIQTLVEDTAPQYVKKGAVIVMEPYSGAVLAMASLPAFHPDTVAESIEAAEGALINRALALYDCGSVFKTVTAAAALERGIGVQQTYDCTGGMTVVGTTFHCHQRLGHQMLSFTQAFARSCNLYFIQLAERIGGKAVRDTALSCGFGEEIKLADGITAPAAVLPTEQELLHGAALANFSFGQGKLLASPLHITRLTAAVASGGALPTPHLIRGYLDEQGGFSAETPPQVERAFSEKTARILQTMMEEVVTNGTGQQAHTTVCATAGKTGTAQTGQMNGDNPVVQSWFTGYFPADNPRYVITVLGEDAENTDSKTAALFRKLAEELMK